MTPEDVQLGDTIWSKTRRSDDTHRGGMVADAGVTSDGEPYFVVLEVETTKVRRMMGQRSWQAVPTVKVRRMFYGDVDWTIPKNERTAAAMIGRCRQCWVTAGIGCGYIGPVDEELMAAAQSLRNEVRAIQNPRALNAS